ncbi:hypothetical protein IWT140_02209 [Secundilactobacillus pentosiphilus]|uniref:Uncharacterized protein n=1 Tax=Secundilactobacillus pentosiphilus TaxID=1714682 RepID=A0A1Z5IS18_9LACO|nr:hypothetical protein IWT140_02209 [Secundilactobacillus pentosiphilus]
MVTTDQIKFKNYFVKVFMQHDDDVIRSLSWMNSHFNYMPDDVRLSYHHLSSLQKNAVIKEICMLGD